VQETKNGTPLELPLSGWLCEILAAREETALTDHVFPGEGGNGYLIEPRKYVSEVIRRSGVRFTLHDLRRTFITIAEGLDISAYAIKRLVNHRMSGDVTAGYIVSNPERLREPMARISNFIIGCSETSPARPTAAASVLGT
jgi:integrase